MSEEPADRRERRRVLFEMEAQIDDLPVHQITMPQLTEMKILVQPLELNVDSTLKPLFFIPYQSYPDLDKMNVKGTFPDLGDEHDHRWGSHTRPVDAAYRLELYLSDYMFAFNCGYPSKSLWTGPG